MKDNNKNQWRNDFYVPKRVDPVHLSSQISAQAEEPEMREQQKAEGRARDGAAAARLKAVNYLNRLNQTQWQKISEYLTQKFSTTSPAKDSARNRVRTKTK